MPVVLGERYCLLPFNYTAHRYDIFRKCFQWIFISLLSSCQMHILDFLPEAAEITILAKTVGVVETTVWNCYFESQGLDKPVLSAIGNESRSGSASTGLTNPIQVAGTAGSGTVFAGECRGEDERSVCGPRKSCFLILFSVCCNCYWKHNVNSKRHFHKSLRSVYYSSKWPQESGREMGSKRLTNMPGCANLSGLT